MSLSPDELIALADEADAAGPWPSPLPIALRDIAPSLARDLAAWQAWAEHARDALMCEWQQTRRWRDLPLGQSCLDDAFTPEMRCPVCALLAGFPGTQETNG